MHNQNEELERLIEQLPIEDIEGFKRVVEELQTPGITAKQAAKVSKMMVPKKKRKKAFFEL